MALIGAYDHPDFASNDGKWVGLMRDQLSRMCVQLSQISSAPGVLCRFPKRAIVLFVFAPQGCL